jgi:DNA repair exonuclease SbcCD ATPase subunit
MIIKKLTICNFRSYFGVKEFVFSNKLNLILGSNGDGKTTFFEALNWVLTPTEAAKQNKETDVKLESLISAKMLRNLPDGESDKVYVSIEITYDTGKFTKNKIIERGFTVTKKAGRPELSNVYHDSFDCRGGRKDKKDMLLRGVLETDAAFPAVIKKYHLFKGEDKLNIFDNKETLQNLLDLYSDVKDIVPFKQFASYAEKMAEKAMGTNKAKASKQAKDLEEVNKEIVRLTKELEKYEIRLSSTKKEYEDAEAKLEGLKDDMASINKIRELQDKQKDWKREIGILQRRIDEEYGRMLLDSQWILMGFAPILNEYNHKMSSFLMSKQNIEEDYKKKQEEEFDKTKTEKAKTELEKIAWKMNDVEKMKYMLHTHRCAICGTEALEGSITYDFIKQRIHDVIELLTPKPTDERVELKRYFSAENIEELKKMGEKLADEESRTHVDVEGIPNAIQAKFDQNQKWRDGIAERENLLEKTNKKIAQLNASSISGVNLLEFANDIESVNKWYEQRETSGIERNQLLQVIIPKVKEELQKKREEQKKLMKATGNDSLYDVFMFFRHFCNAVESTEESTTEELLKNLSKNANVFLSQLNVDDFTGVIRIYMHNGNLAIDLQDRNGKIITNPNTSLLTTMHISILLAISELTKDSRKAEYPLIFDAPTSSFDEGKDKSFYDCLNANIDKQCIVVTKSFLYKDANLGEYMIDREALKKLNCKKFRIRKLSDSFDKLDIATIDTQVTEIKED